MKYHIKECSSKSWQTIYIWFCNFKAPTHFCHAGVFLKVCPLTQIVNQANAVKIWQWKGGVWCLKTGIINDKQSGLELLETAKTLPPCLYFETVSHYTVPVA